MLVSSDDRRVLAPDLAGAVAHARVDPTFGDALCMMRCAGRSLPADMVWLRHDLGGCDWAVDHAG